MAQDEQAGDPIRVWFRLLRLETRIRSAMSERLRAIGLSVPQCDVLTTLTEQEGMSQQDLAKRLYVTKGNISGLIDRLEEAGMVERRPTPEDRRSHAIFLTETGRSAAKAGLALQHAYVAETFGRLAGPDLAEFERLIVLAREQVRAAQEAAKPEAAQARRRSTR